MSRIQTRNNPGLMDKRLLTQRLVAEFEDYNNANQTYHQPLISLEAALGSIHLLVIWDAFYIFSQQERSQIIMDAYKQWKGEAEALRVTIAMGLTQDDATHLGVDFLQAEA